ncbi:DOMON-like domain-containing protein [Sphingomonas sp. AX6]|uniref:DOMON-like domain-containing protein n=1 Tax=Sphingomonas sp. AX6 TaxID=2653171 RepID=UPI0012F1B127|nr:DOMON-like domain-containing protein [Sphingomonas sp. AX6]VXC93295.1 conserved hypothetical protein [Sphingomonas sp. AX6]
MSSLRPHSETLPVAAMSLSVSAIRTLNLMTLGYRIDGDAGAIVFPKLATGERRDGLWQTTCFEVFIQPAGVIGYHEFNFSPSTDWASYSFDAHRAGMRDAPGVPMIERTADGMNVTVDLSAYPDLADVDWHVGLTTVIEEKDGTKSYWALKHPEGAPDFHDATCFALELPAVG